MNYKIYNENCLVQLDQMKENCIDSIVTDPPYELNFMGKGMRLKKLGQPSKRKRIIVIDDVEYESVTDAMIKLNISTRKLYKLLNDERKEVMCDDRKV